VETQGRSDNPERLKQLQHEVKEKDRLRRLSLNLTFLSMQVTFQLIVAETQGRSDNPERLKQLQHKVKEKDRLRRLSLNLTFLSMQVTFQLIVAERVRALCGLAD
jgi:predicted membrane protein